MTEDEKKRLAALEKTTQGFNLVTNGVNVEGGFEKLKRNATESERLAHLEEIHKNFQIVGGSNVTVEGSLFHGYAICATCPDTGAATGSGVPQPIPPTITGACCDDEGNCTVQSQAACESGGGAYQGDGTDCDPNPCPEPPEDEGACCRDEVCTIETQASCEGDGGIYHGDGTDCDPNPCVEEPFGACCVDGECTDLTASGCADVEGTYLGDGSECSAEDDPRCCPCGFDAFDGSGRKFLTYNRTITGNFSVNSVLDCPPPDGYDETEIGDVSAEYAAHYDESCDLIVDTDTATSSRDGGIDSGDPCSEANVGCFCNSVFPFNECSGFIQQNYCNCSVSSGSTSDETTATTRTTTTDFTDDCSVASGACLGGNYTCEITGSYVVTETLSEECVVGG